MQTFKVLRQQDAFVEYVAEVDASSLKEAVDFAYEQPDKVKWTKRGVHTYDACRVVALDDRDNEIGFSERE